ncbi:MAG: c-type cytochrome [Sulfuritalea sp.]|nr:c-type cytochrome [Sulfuritalea sp.]
MKHALSIAAALAVTVLASFSAYAADGAKLYMEKTCIACHGKDAKTPLKGMPYPKLAGQSAAYAEQQMKDIKSGARSNGQSAAMKGVMHLVSDAEIKVLADYLSKLK